MTDHEAISRTHALGLITLGAGVAALGAAFVAQYGEGLSPCALCLLARWPYRLAVVCGALAMALQHRHGRAALWGGLACFAAAVAIAALQTGVERHLWRSPFSTCSAPALTGLAGTHLLAALPARPVTPCDQPVYPLPGLTVSMAEISLAYSLGASAGLACLLTLRHRQ